MPSSSSRVAQLLALGVDQQQDRPAGMVRTTSQHRAGLRQASSMPIGRVVDGADHGDVGAVALPGAGQVDAVEVRSSSAVREQAFEQGLGVHGQARSVADGWQGTSSMSRIGSARARRCPGAAQMSQRVAAVAEALAAAAQQRCSASSAARVEVGRRGRAGDSAAARKAARSSSTSTSHSPSRQRCLPPMVRQTSARSRRVELLDALGGLDHLGPGQAEPPLLAHDDGVAQAGDDAHAAEAAVCAADRARSPECRRRATSSTRAHHLGHGDQAGIGLVQAHAAGLDQQQHGGRALVAARARSRPTSLAPCTSPTAAAHEAAFLGGDEHGAAVERRRGRRRCRRRRRPAGRAARRCGLITRSVGGRNSRKLPASSRPRDALARRGLVVAVLMARAPVDVTAAPRRPGRRRRLTDRRRGAHVVDGDAHVGQRMAREEVAPSPPPRSSPKPCAAVCDLDRAGAGQRGSARSAPRGCRSRPRRPAAGARAPARRLPPVESRVSGVSMVVSLLTSCGSACGGS